MRHFNSIACRGITCCSVSTITYKNQSAPPPGLLGNFCKTLIILWYHNFLDSHGFEAPICLLFLWVMGYDTLRPSWKTVTKNVDSFDKSQHFIAFLSLLCNSWIPERDSFCVDGWIVCWQYAINCKVSMWSRVLFWALFWPPYYCRL